MLIAADYPFLDVFWTMILFFLWVAWIWVLVIIIRTCSGATTRRAGSKAL